ncbi:MAG: hypothetical protein J1F22_01405 [Lachnospiraceae bacterium]|nr:hypothetical protein [Lachnospiraceae bacterium]
MKRFIRIKCIILALVLMCQFVLVKQEAQAQVNAASATVKLSFSGKTATCGAKIVGLSGVNKITGTLKLKKIENKTTTTIKTWTISESARTMAMTKTYKVSSTGQYKVVMSVKVYKGGEAQQITMSISRFCI